MKILIDIPDDDFTSIRCEGLYYIGHDRLAESVTTAFQQGKIIPAGHGDLIDRSKLKIVNLGIGDYDVWGVEDYAIADAPTVIPADKGK